MNNNIESIRNYLGNEADYLLNHTCNKIKKESLHLPSSDFIDRVYKDTDRPTQVLRNLKSIILKHLLCCE